MSKFSRTACSLAPAYFHHWRSKLRIAWSRAEISLAVERSVASAVSTTACSPDCKALAESISRPPGARDGSGRHHRRRRTTSMSFVSALRPGVSWAKRTGTITEVTLILPTLPSFDLPPGPRITDPLPSDRPVRWGILATGKIARSFAQDLALLPDAQIAAVGSRRLASAEEFANEYDVAAAYGSYEELVADPTVDVVYVATPHALHKQHVLMAFDAGKPVLCEKALTLNARDAEELVSVAREKQLFFMEAMWMRCNPVIRRLQQLSAGGHLGQIQQVRADLGSFVDLPSTDRMLAPELGGGALLDMG